MKLKHERQYWTPALDAQLAELWAAKRADGTFENSASTIALHFHVSKNSIIGRAHRLNLERRPVPIGVRKPEGGKKLKRIGRPGPVKGGFAAMGGDTLSVLIPMVSLPETRTTHGGREVPMDARRDGVRGPTLSTTLSGRLAAFLAVGCARTCQWPMNDAKPWRFCDAPSATGFSYCAEHRVRAFVPRHAERGDPLPHNVGF